MEKMNVKPATGKFFNAAVRFGRRTEDTEAAEIKVKQIWRCRCITENFFVHDVFDFVDLFTSHRRGVNKVEAGSVAINHGAALLNMDLQPVHQCWWQWPEAPCF